MNKFPLFFLLFYAKIIYSSLVWRNIGHVKLGALLNNLEYPRRLNV